MDAVADGEEAEAVVFLEAAAEEAITLAITMAMTTATVKKSAIAAVDEAEAWLPGALVLMAEPAATAEHPGADTEVLLGALTEEAQLLTGAAGELLGAVLGALELPEAVQGAAAEEPPGVTSEWARKIILSRQWTGSRRRLQSWDRAKICCQNLRRECQPIQFYYDKDLRGSDSRFKKNVINFLDPDSARKQDKD